MLPKWLWIPNSLEKEFNESFSPSEWSNYTEVIKINTILTVIILILMYHLNWSFEQVFLFEVMKISLYVAFFQIRHDHIKRLEAR